MSQMLEKYMGAAYKPDEEWTSGLRTRAGFRPWQLDEDLPCSTFTINDRSGSFTRMLTRNGYRDSTHWGPSPTFHLDLITVEGTIEDSTFCLHPHQIEMVSTLFPGSGLFSRLQ